MSASDSIKLFVIVLATIVSVPTVVVLIKAGFFFGRMSRSISAVEAAAEKFTDRVDQLLDKVCDQLGDHEVRLAVLEKTPPKVSRSDGYNGVPTRQTDSAPVSKSE